MRLSTLSAVLLAAAVGCRSGDTGTDRAPDRRAARDSAGGETVDTGAMAGMDHSKMPGMAKATPSTSGEMASIDHSKMPGMAKATPSTGGETAGTDHSKMPGMTKVASSTSNATAGMDHSKMPSMAPSTRTRETSTMPGVDHAGMAMSTKNLEFGADPADEKLKQVVALLVRDSIVMRRIQADPSLRATWADQAVRRLIINDPGKK